ncbi:hypothetical protein DRQ11_05335 [candidate division KSB1 bacterium]|nr:MAG: hypothetical protein DRQ11_05335 [candidate division KSB1 bacterium]
MLFGLYLRSLDLFKRISVLYLFSISAKGSFYWFQEFGNLMLRLGFRNILKGKKNLLILKTKEEAYMKKAILIFCFLGFLVVPLTQQRVMACHVVPNIEDLVFEGKFLFDLNGTYSVDGIEFPLHVMADLGVFEDGKELGQLFLYGQENCPSGDWNGIYFGHWTFQSVGCGCDYEIGLFRIS